MQPHSLVSEYWDPCVRGHEKGGFWKTKSINRINRFAKMGADPRTLYATN